MSSGFHAGRPGQNVRQSIGEPMGRDDRNACKGESFNCAQFSLAG